MILSDGTQITPLDNFLADIVAELLRAGYTDTELSARQDDQGWGFDYDPYAGHDERACAEQHGDCPCEPLPSGNYLRYAGYRADDWATVLRLAHARLARLDGPR